MAKLSHAAVDYGDGMDGHYCFTCKHFENGKPPHCRIVKDPIKREGWCERYAKASAFGYRADEIGKS